MKGILGLLRQRSQAERSGEEQLDSVMFTTAFADQGVDPSLLVPWEARATEVGAKTELRTGHQDTAKPVGQRQIHESSG